MNALKRTTIIGLVVLGSLGGARGAAAQSEVQVTGLWVQDFVRGTYVSLFTEDLVGAVRYDTVYVNGMPITRVVARRWMVQGKGGVGLVDEAGGKGLAFGTHAEVAWVRRFPGATVDRAGLAVQAWLPQGGVGMAGVARAKAVFWAQAGAVWDGGTWHPTVGVSVPRVLLVEVCRFVLLCRGSPPDGG